MVGALLALIAAASPGARLEYSVQPGLERCPDETWVRAAVAARLGRDPFRADGAIHVLVRLTQPAPPALVATLEVSREGRVGRRTLESPAGDCLELASSVELALALALDPLVPRQSEPEPPVAAPAPPPPAPVAQAPVLTAPAEAPRPALGWRAHAGLLAMAGAVPGFTGGLALGGGLSGRGFSVSLEGRVHLPTGLVYGASRASTFLALGSLLPCFEPGRFSACLVASLGALQVEDGAVRATVLMGQAGARVQVAFEPWRQVRLRPWLEAAVVLTRTSLQRDEQVLWVTWPVAVSAGLTVEWHSPS
ncbi:MAG: hypothetical protein ACOZQL_14280 [Myxococcota bacterium]